VRRVISLPYSFKESGRQLLPLLVGLPLISSASPLFSQSLVVDNFLDNYDGDTLTVNLANLPSVFSNRLPIRISGIDTPEIRGKCKREKALAQEAKKLVKRYLDSASEIVLHDVQRGKYFRVVARVEADGVDIGAELLKKGLAVAYDGGTKTVDWCKK
jgi:micrococcal nuclease